MADGSGGAATDFYTDLFLLQKRLKGERLFIRQDKDIIRSLNDSVSETCKNVYHLAWSTRQHWRNLERLISGARVFPSDCSKTAISIEGAVFEDACKHLGYQDAKYGEFLSGLRKNPSLVALVLNCATKSGVDITGLARLLMCSLYGSCLLKEDEIHVLLVLKTLMHVQVMHAEDVVQYFCSPKSSSNAFTVFLRLYSELLFSSKLYLTAALHGAVMQIIVDDSVYLDLDMNAVLSRLQPKTIRDKFGDPGTPKSHRKMMEYSDFLQSCLINLCNKFLKSLKDKIYCFPTSLQWVFRQLELAIRTKTQNNEKTKALLGHVLINHFICPAIINPEPFGINSDAFVSETARYNLVQVAGILRSLALAELGMKDPKTQNILAAFEPGTIPSFVDAVLHDAEKLDPLKEKETVEGLHPNGALMTEKELKSLIHFMKKIQTENDSDLKSNGIDQLLELLPPMPRRWTKPKAQPKRGTPTSLPIEIQLKANPEMMLPIPSPRTNRLRGKKKPVSMIDIPVPALDAVVEEENEQAPANDKEEYEAILKELSDMIDEQEVVLVISYGNDIDNLPGTLPEEKVLGLKDEEVADSAPVDSNDVEQERQRRASTMIQGAMKDLEGLNFHESTIDESPGDKSKYFNDSIMSDASTTTPGSTPGAASLIDLEMRGSSASVKTPNSLDGSSLAWPSPSNISSTPNQQNNLLINFEEMNSQQNTILTPQKTDRGTPSQNDSLLDLSPTDDKDAFNFPSRNTADLFANKAATLRPRSYQASAEMQPFEKTASLGRTLDMQPISQRPSQVSSGSLLSGLNKMLQEPQPSSSNPFGFPDDDVFARRSSSDAKFEGSVEIAEDTMLTEEESTNLSDSSDSIPDTDGTNPENTQRPVKVAGRDSGFADADFVTSGASAIQSLSQASFEQVSGMKNTNVIKSNVIDTKQGKQLKKQIEQLEKRDRKKSWIDKLVLGKGKIKNVKLRTESDGQHLRRDQLLRQDRKFTEPQSQLKHETNYLDTSAKELSQNAASPIPDKSAEDISEEILKKYRNIQPQPAGLMEDDQSCNDRGRADFAKQAEFDEDFKFEDAKRKLRLVLCMADRSNFPSGASNCFQLLMTFLQAQLAEAINLQDRSVVAQLHETLRSIRQLPSGSCEKLLSALEVDYKQRAPYISYLLRSKQGLLSSLSHLEQIRKKVERDKAICSKYFTAVCVRLFLETPEKKKEITQFSHKFEVTGMVDEKCAMLEEFLENLYREMSSDPMWVAALEEQWDDAKIATERTIMSKIYKAAFYPNGMQDIQNDKIFHEHILRLSKTITVNHAMLQIPKVLQKEAPWPSAQTELLMINAYKTPADKLNCIHRCCIAIMNLLSMATPSQTSGADEFVPVLVYVLIRANPPNLLSTKQYINNFFDNRFSGEEMYCWTQFCAATEFVKSIKS